MKHGITPPPSGPLPLPLSINSLQTDRPYRRGALLLDFDGTLAPIVSRPEKARLSPQVRHKLNRFSQNPRWVVAVITGRQLQKIKKLVRLPHLIYVGNHGLEVEFPGEKPQIHPDAIVLQPLLQRLSKDLSEKLNGLPGVLLENKIWTLSLHTRMANHERERMAHEIFRDVVRSPLRRNEIVVMRGKKVLEVRPNISWNKGDAVHLILNRLGGPVLPVYVGDDNTDEDAFYALHEQGIGIRVGHGESWARYSIDSPNDIPQLFMVLDGLLVKD